MSSGPSLPVPNCPTARYRAAKMKHPQHALVSRDVDCLKRRLGKDVLLDNELRSGKDLGRSNQQNASYGIIRCIGGRKRLPRCRVGGIEYARDPSNGDPQNNTSDAHVLGRAQPAPEADETETTNEQHNQSSHHLEE
ncbi:hypothetical protein MY3957_003022 [Beauveria namnaoensis]